MWIANSASTSVTEVNDADGSWIRTLTGGHGFSGPGAITFDGGSVWVANTGANSITEVSAADGSWIQTLSGSSYGFGNPAAIAFDGGHLWVWQPEPGDGDSAMMI